MATFDLREVGGTHDLTGLAGPWIPAGAGTMKHRVVLHLMGRDWATHVETEDEDGRRGFVHGHYFGSDQAKAARDFADRLNYVLEEAS